METWQKWHETVKNGTAAILRYFKYTKRNYRESVHTQASAKRCESKAWAKLADTADRTSLEIFDPFILHKPSYIYLQIIILLHFNV